MFIWYAHHTIDRIITAVVCGTIWDGEGCIRTEGMLGTLKLILERRVGVSIDPSKSFRKNDRLAVALLSTSEVRCSSVSTGK